MAQGSPPPGTTPPRHLTPSRPSPSGALRLRLLTAAVGLPLVLAAAWLGTAWVAVAALVAALAALHEFFALSGGPRAPWLERLGYLWGAAVIVAAYARPLSMVHVLAAGLLLSLVVLLALRRRDALLPWAWTATGVLYVPLLLSYAILLRDLPQGREWLLFALLATFAADTGAYAVGRLRGRHPMAPSISPGKTWEGAAGGLACAVLAAVALALLLRLPVAWPVAALLGALVAVAAAAGDLAESLLKRSAGVKEAGSILPGHGGILDRLDSVVFSLPALYYGVAAVLR